MEEMVFEDEFGCFDGMCRSCDDYARVNDVGLCSVCAGKFERDLIRQRDWDYSAAAYGLPDSKCDKLRNKVIADFGDSLELLAPTEEGKKKLRKLKKRSRRHR